MYATFEELGNILRHLYHSVWEHYDYYDYSTCAGLPGSTSRYLSAEFHDVIDDFYDRRKEFEQDDWMFAVGKRLQEVGAQEMDDKGLWGDR